jgi:hypothetical protein
MLGMLVAMGLTAVMPFVGAVMLALCGVAVLAGSVE